MTPTPGPVRVSAYLSPRNNVLPTEGLRYAVLQQLVVETAEQPYSYLGPPASRRTGH
ncbi:hypothetical protein O7626_16430 [Micromonospora sp. WMMD1102]|uniref:hypothetical protein n=1 Tax=Micromonospora sp. WMMD1102 TaxID=3016105 RepID=UPI0024155C9A|nr:hypothetical protein [Micromonospora sp. WMMD1102]MDG4787501.1 hypothetical protein [Micromonospora sp. WMMD1102]